MKIFINDIPIRIIKEKELPSIHAFSMIINRKQNINPKLMIDNVLIENPDHDKVDRLLQLMTKRKYKKVGMITITCTSKKEMTAYLKSRFTVIKAGGGVVENKGKFLMIYRKNIWDLPKGKKDENEKIMLCAKREVEEETGVKVKVSDKITAIWHTYMQNKKYILKKTYWYAMTCLDDSKMKPQKEEGITKIKWMTMIEMQESLIGSYRSLRYLIQEYKQYKRKKESQN